MKPQMILCLAIVLLFSSCSSSVEVDETTMTISDIASNMAVDIDTALANLGIDESAAVSKNSSTSESYTMPQQKWSVFEQPFDLQYSIQDGKLCGIGLTMSIIGTEDETFQALKDMYYSIENEFGLPETYPKINNTTIKIDTVETIVKEERLGSDSEVAGGTCNDYWFFADEDKEIYIDLSCSYGGGMANYVVRFVDTEAKLNGRYVYKNLVRKSQGDADVEFIVESY